MRDLNTFNSVALDRVVYTLVWPNGADFDPATLHDWPEHEAGILALAQRWAVSAGPGTKGNRLYAAHDEGIDAAIINPDGFTRGYPALVTAISRVKFPTIEVHISNPARRGTHSDIAPAAQGAIASFGIAGYDLALRGLKELLAK